MGARSRFGWRRAALIAGLCAAFLFWRSGGSPSSVNDERPLAALPPLRPSDRVLILAPHPDDEVLGCGGVIQQALAMGLPLRIVFFTYGDNNQWSFLIYRKYPVLAPGAVQRMGLVRHDEAVAASRALGVPPEQLTFLGYPDFGTLQMWKSHWGDRPPLQSMLTHATAVPYANALHPGAPYTGDSALADLTEILHAFQPTKVFVSHPADHMPDHAALYLFTRVALWDLAGPRRPEVYPYLIHFRRWPAPRGFRPEESLEPPAFFREEISWRSLPLTPEQVTRNHEAIRAHRSQFLSSASYLLSFIRPNELFGEAPPVVLGASAAVLQHGTASREELLAPTEQLTESERAAFVGVETRAVQLTGDHLVLSLEFSRPLGRAVIASVYVFGYRPDRPFTQMPKLHVQLGPLHSAAFDQDHRLPRGTIRVERRARRMRLIIPLSVLGDPQRILISAQTYLGDIPLDWTSWRILELPARRAAAHSHE